MNKKTSILAIMIILIAIASFIFLRFEKLKVNVNTVNISSLDCLVFDGSELKYKRVTNKEDISKVIDYINSLSLSRTSLRPKDAGNSIRIIDNDGNLVKSFAFGESGILWVGKKTYNLGNSNTNNLKALILKLQ